MKCVYCKKSHHSFDCPTEDLNLPKELEDYYKDLDGFNKWLENSGTTYLMSKVQNVRLFYKMDMFCAWLASRETVPEKLIKDINDVLKVQGNDGNWNYDPYMQGMYNGMELIAAIAEKREPVFKNAPVEWLKDSPRSLTDKPTAEEAR